MTPTGRFAPSPTGRMHLGNVMTALLSYLSVKSRAGKWILRIEDLDRGRSRSEFVRLIEEDLLWLGLEWDEGGSADPGYCQSARTEIYDHYFHELEKTGLVYPCYCSRADLNAENAPHADDGRVIYAGTCRPVRLGGSKDPECNSRRPSWRICVPDTTVVTDDLHYGKVAVNLAESCGDFVIRRSDGTYGYQFAVVVDDALMGVTEVVRGSDLLLSAPQQSWLHGLLGFEPPVFAHSPLLCAADGRRLCKRDRDLDMEELRKRFSPCELLGKLAGLSGLGRDDSPVSLKELEKSFSWDRIPGENIIIR